MSVPGLNTEMTGGVLGKLVQVTSAVSVHVHAAEPARKEPPAQVPAELPPDISPR